MIRSSADIVPRLVQRHRVITAVRRFFDHQGYIEVETPNRIPAPAPEAHIDAPPAGDWFLHTSPELCMKRLLTAGCGNIYQICKCYRQGERGNRHLPEMTLLEWYTAGADYRDMMVQCEQLIGSVAADLGLGHRLTYQGNVIDLTPPWPRLTVAEAFGRHAGMSVARALAEDRFDERMGIAIEPRLGLDQPVLLCDYPPQCAALARIRDGNPPVAERFELYIAGLELCNAFSELTDARIQRRRFAAEAEARRQAGKPVYPMPEPFLKALDGMPPAAGNALGIDRLVMLLSDAASIDQTVAFAPEDL